MLQLKSGSEGTGDTHYVEVKLGWKSITYLLMGVTRPVQRKGGSHSQGPADKPQSEGAGVQVLDRGNGLVLQSNNIRFPPDWALEGSSLPVKPHSGGWKGLSPGDCTPGLQAGLLLCSLEQVSCPRTSPQRAVWGTGPPSPALSAGSGLRLPSLTGC